MEYIVIKTDMDGTSEEIGRFTDYTEADFIRNKLEWDSFTEARETGEFTHKYHIVTKGEQI